MFNYVTQPHPDSISNYNSDCSSISNHNPNLNPNSDLGSDSAILSNEQLCRYMRAFYYASLVSTKLQYSFHFQFHFPPNTSQFKYLPGIDKCYKIYEAKIDSRAYLCLHRAILWIILIRGYCWTRCRHRDEC